MRLQGGAEPKIFVETPGGTVQIGGASANPAAVYEALKASRSELRQQLENLEDKRSDLRQELEQQSDGVSRKGIEQRITDIDARITAVDQQVALADQAVARAAAVPNAIVPPKPEIQRGPPEEVVALSALFMLVVLLPITIAFARRIWRKSAGIVASIPSELGERFSRLEQAVDAIAVEVERIGEGQRYVTRVFTEESQQRALGAGAAQPIELEERLKAELRR